MGKAKNDRDKAKATYVQSIKLDLRYETENVERCAVPELIVQMLTTLLKSQIFNEYKPRIVYADYTDLMLDPYTVEVKT